MMKKCISLLLALVIILTLAACGGVGDVVGRNTPNNTNGAASQVSNAESNESGKDEIISGKSADRVINPSELLEAEDATKIFGKDFESAERDVEAGLQSALLCRYSSWDGVTDLQLGIIIMQDAILDETKSFDKKLIESGGITGYNQNEKGKLSEEGAIPAEGIGEWALMEDVSGDAVERTKFTLLRIDGESFTVKREHMDESGAVVETMEHTVSFADYNKRLEGMAARAKEVTREFVIVKDREIPVTAVHIVSDTKDGNGDDREFKLWISDEIPLGGLAKTWSSDPAFPSAEVVDFGF